MASETRRARIAMNPAVFRSIVGPRRDRLAASAQRLRFAAVFVGRGGFLHDVFPGPARNAGTKDAGRGSEQDADSGQWAGRAKSAGSGRREHPGRGGMPSGTVPDDAGSARNAGAKGAGSGRWEQADRGGIPSGEISVEGYDAGRAGELARHFTDADADGLCALLDSPFWTAYPHPVVVDIRKALSIWNAQAPSGDWAVGADGADGASRADGADGAVGADGADGSVSQNQARDRAAADALRQARFSFFGTDGIRGKTSGLAASDPAAEFLEHNILSAELVAAACEAFGRMLGGRDGSLDPETDSGAGNGSGRSGRADRVDRTVSAARGAEPSCFRAVVGNDGRDRAAGWRYNGAVHAGFARAGFNLFDLGTVPTPYVPWRMLKDGIRAGAVLTASHNPANQNGIKFFLDGKKILPEGETGDFALSAYTAAVLSERVQGNSSAREGAVPRDGCEAAGADPTDDGVSHRGACGAAGARITDAGVFTADQDFRPVPGGFVGSTRDACTGDTIEALPADCAAVLTGAEIVLDSANGAFFELAPAVLDRLALAWTTVNERADGANINERCGVAEIEGSLRFAAKDTAPAVVRVLFERGRASRRCVYGIVLDGDGDRGFVLVYDRESEEVLVLDGDRMGVILASHFLGSDDGPRGHVVMTVESDLMAARHVRRVLGVPAAIVSVGDKWIGSYAGGPVLVGEEVSGHLMFPIPVATAARPDGTESPVLLAGNGILGTLMTIYALEKDRANPAFIREPFEPGFTITYYTYFVDKTRFFPGSRVWNDDVRTIRDRFESALADYPELGGFDLRFEEKEDPGILYAAFREDGVQTAAVFCRNSGTEDKTAVYVQSRQDVSAPFRSIGEAVAEHHRRTLKDTGCAEYRIERTVLALLSTGVGGAGVAGGGESAAGTIPAGTHGGGTGDAVSTVRPESGGESAAGTIPAGTHGGGTGDAVSTVRPESGGESAAGAMTGSASAFSADGVDFEGLIDSVLGAGIPGTSRADVAAVLHGLKKEGRISIDGGTVFAVEPNQ